MKLQKTTLFLLIFALGLGLVVYINETQQSSPQANETTSQQPIFNFSEQEINRLTVETENDTLVFEKTGNLPLPWEMQEPEEVTANDAAVVFLLDLLAKENYTSSFTTSDLSEYGLEQPLATVTVGLANNETHQLVLGGRSFNGNSLYALIDPPSNNEGEEVTVVLVSANFQNGVQRELEEWKVPVSE